MDANPPAQPSVRLYKADLGVHLQGRSDPQQRGGQRQPVLVRHSRGGVCEHSLGTAIACAQRVQLRRTAGRRMCDGRLLDDLPRALLGHGEVDVERLLVPYTRWKVGYKWQPNDIMASQG